MKKTVKKSFKKKKKKSFIKKLFKTIGICTASVIGFVGASIGIYALFGGLNPKVVPLEGMQFEQQAYVLTGYADTQTGKVLVGYKDKTTGEVFESVKVLPTNEDATKLDITLSGGKDLVTYHENNKVGSPLVFEIQQETGYDEIRNTNSHYNKTGGEFNLTATQYEDDRTTSTKVFIESAVQSFSLKAQNAGGNFDKNKIYPGDKFSLSIDNFFPSNAFDKPANCNNADDAFYKTYGANYFKKQALFVSSQESIATVDPLTGEIKVESAGKFVITCYLPTTYKSNAEMPKIGDDDFITKISDTTKYVAVSKEFESKSIEVAGIRATTSTIENLNVFETFTYSALGNNQGAHYINLDLSLLPPSSYFQSSQLNYRLSDVQIFEGYKENDKFYVLGGQKEAINNSNIIMSKHFTIKKFLNTKSWNIRVESHSAQDTYLIARITDKVDNDNYKLELPEESAEINVETDKEKGIYYAFIKVKTNKVTETDTLEFVNARILAQFNSTDTDKFLYLSKNKILDLTSSEIFTNPKQIQTYKIVKYFVSKGSNFIDCKDTFDGLNPEIQLYSKKETQNEDGSLTTEFVKDDNGGLVKLTDDLTSLDEIEIYAAIFEYQYKLNEETGDYIEYTDEMILENNEIVVNGLICTYVVDEDNKYASRVEKSNSMVITVSNFIEFSNFKFNGNEISNDIKINKGENLEISFETTNSQGLFNSRDLFVVKCLSSTENLILEPNKNFSVGQDNQTIILTGLNSGEGKISIEFNGEKIVLGKIDNKEVTEFTLKVEKNDVKSIAVESSDVESNNNISFSTVVDSNEIKFKINNLEKTPATNFTFKVSVTGGTENTSLKFRLLDDGLILNETKQQLTSVSDNNKVEIWADATTILGGEKGIYTKTFNIFPHKLCKNLRFYVYTIVDGEEIKSNTITISVNGPTKDDIVENQNSNNNITINSVGYQQVIGGLNFELKDYIKFNTYDDLKSWLLDNCLEIQKDENDFSLYKIDGTSFADITKSKICKITLKPSFWTESEYKTFNFYILPQEFLRTTTLEMNAGDSKTIEDLKSQVSLVTRKYDETNKPTGAYKGNITESTSALSNSCKFYVYDSVNSTKGEEITNKYVAPNTLLSGNAKILCEVTAQDNAEKTITGIINVQISSNCEVEQQKGVSSNFANNGETITLSELFTIKDKQTNSEISDAIKKVTLTKNSIVILNQFGIKFLKEDLNEVEFSKISDATGVNLDNLLKSVKKIKIPEELNVYEINNLSADIEAEINGASQTKQNHEFSLLFKLTELNLNVGDTVYLIGNEYELNEISKTTIINNYVVSATESSQQGTIQDVKNSIEITLEGITPENKNGKIIFKLNEVTKTFNCVVLENLLEKADTTIVVSKAYKVSDLIKLNEAYTENETIKTAFENATFVKVSGEDYSLQENNKVLVIKTSSEDFNITFKMLGREITISNFSCKSIEVLSALPTSIYSNIEYTILNEETKNLINNNNLIFEIKALENGVVCNDIEYIFNNGLPVKFVAKNYAGSQKTISFSYTINSKGYEGITINKNDITLNSLIVNAKFEGETYNGKQVLLNGFEYVLQNYFDVLFNTQKYFEITDKPTLSFYLDGTEVSNKLTNYTPSYTQDKEISLEIKLDDNVVATLGFYVRVYNLQEAQSEKTYFAGQTLTKEEIIKLVNIVDFGGNIVNNDELKSKLEITNSSGIIESITLGEGGNSIRVNFGQKQINLTIIAKKVYFTDKADFIAYPATRITNYVKCYIINDAGSNNYLTLNYSFENLTNVQENDNIQKLYSGLTLIAQLNVLTGELTIESEISADEQIKILAYIQGTSKQASNTSKTLIFTIHTIIKEQPESAKDLYVGDQRYDLSQLSYFVVESENKQPDFEVDSINDNGLKLNYIPSVNTITNEYLISKDNKVVAKLVYSENGNRCYLQTTSELDSVTLTLKGYLKLNSNDYTLESLRTNFVTLVINMIKIDVNFEKLETILVDSKTYYVLDKSSGYKLDPVISGGKDSLKITGLTFASNKDEHFIGKVNEEIKLSFIKKLQNLSLDEKDSYMKTLLLPNQNSSINITYSDGYFKITNNTQMLVDYVFVTLNYSVDAYNSSVYICLKPEFNISYEYDSVNESFSSVFSPSAHKLSKTGTLLSFNKTLSEDKTILLDDGTVLDFKIDFSKMSTVCPSKDQFESLFASGTANHEIKLLYNTSSGYNISITTKKETSSDAFYVIRFTLGENKYYYILKIFDINVEVKDKENNEITKENPIIAVDNNEIDLKEYIYVNGNCLSQSENVDSQLQEFNQNTIFTATSNDIYSLTQDGKFTPKIDAFDTQEIQFSLYNVPGYIYIKGQEITISFKRNGENQENDYTFENGGIYYIYCTSTVDGAKKNVIIDVKNDLDMSKTLDALINFKVTKYNFSGTEITDSSQFAFTTTENVTTYSFMGSALFTVTTESYGYKLEISDSLSGDLQFEISPAYSTQEIKKACNVNSNVVFDVNYTNPVIFESKSYQNVLAGSNFDLKTMITASDLSKLTFSIVEGLNMYVSLNESILVVSDNLKTDAYLKILVKLNSIERYINIKLIPNTKILTNQNIFVCLQNSVINLTDYIKIYKFVGFDSLNLPLYEMTTTFELKKDESYENIANPYNFKIESDLVVRISEINYTFKVVSINDVIATKTFSCLLGEKIDLKNEILNQINASSLTNKDVAISFESTSLVDSNGVFVGNSVTTNPISILVLINDEIELTISITVNNLEISVNYDNSVVKTNKDTLETTKYQNIHALKQSETKKYVNINNNAYFEKLQFSILSITSTNSAIYDQSKFVIQNSQLGGKNSLLVSYNNNPLFVIGQTNIICYENLKCEVLINMALSLEGNTIVSNNFNVRLLPVLINTSNNLEITKVDLIDNMFNLNKLIAINTNAKENNLYLNDNIEFYINSKTEGNLVEKGLLTVGNVGEYTIIAVFEDKEYSLSFVYKNEGDGSGTLFTENFENGLSCLNGGSVAFVSNGASKIGETTKTTFVTFTKEVDNAAIKFKVYDDESNLLFEIDSSGKISNKADKDFAVTITAESGNILQSKCFISKAVGNSITLNENALESGAKYAQENGVMILHILAGKEFDLTGFLNGATITSHAGDLTVTDNIKIKSENIIDITYGYIDVMLSNNVTRIYYKSYPCILEKNYNSDFVYKPDTVLINSQVAINQNDEFKTIYVFDDSNKDLVINLNDYVKNVTQMNFDDKVNYSISKIVTFGEGNNSEYMLYNSSNFGKFASLDSVNLTVKSYNMNSEGEKITNGTMYIYINAKNNNNSLIIAFRVLQLKDNSLFAEKENNTFVVENNSYFNLKDIIKIVAEISDKSIQNIQDIDMFENLNFKLSNSFNSQIKSNKLYVSEKDFQAKTINDVERFVHTIKIKYSYSNILSKEIEVKVLKDNLTYNNNLGNESYLYYNSNQTLYEERWYNENSVTNLSQNFTNIKNAKMNDKNYSITLEKVNFVYNKTKYSLNCYKISNLAIVVNDSNNTDLPKGTILFYNSNYNGTVENSDESTYEYIRQNKLGVILLTVETQKEISENIFAYKEINYKLNNYSITKNENDYELTVNGEVVENELKYSLIILNQNFDVVNNIILTDSEGQSVEMPIVCGKNTLSVGGVTLNTRTGKISGSVMNEITSSGYRLCVKAYIQTENFSFGENYVLFEIV